MMSTDTLKEGDLIVITGSVLKKDEEPELNHILGEVVAVGKKDIFAFDTMTSYKSYRIFRVAKSRCVKLNTDAVSHNEELLEPKLGDLVMSIVEKYNTQEKKIGVLTEIIDVPGRSKQGKILQGEKIEVVSMESLIVL